MKFKTPSGKVINATKLSKVKSISRPVWVMIDGKQYLFKKRVKKSFSDFGEVLVSQILEKAGLPSESFVKYYPVKTKFNKNGTLCKTFLKPCEIMITAYEIFYENVLDKVDAPLVIDSYDEMLMEELKGQYASSVEYAVKQAEEYSKRNSLAFDIKDTEDRLTTMFIADYFLCQLDRHTSNYGFIVNEQEKTMRLVPIFDHGYSLDLDLKEKFIKERLLRPTQYNKKKVHLRFGYSEVGMYDGALRESRYFGKGGIIVSDIIDLYNTNDEAKRLIEKFMGLDIKAEIDACEKQFGYKIPEMHKTHMRNYYNSRLEAIDGFIQNINKRLSKSKTNSKVALKTHTKRVPQSSKEQIEEQNLSV